MLAHTPRERSQNHLLQNKRLHAKRQPKFTVRVKLLGRLCQRNGFLQYRNPLFRILIHRMLINPLCQTRFGMMTDDADIITVFGGTNDFIEQIPFGVMADRTNATFYGSLHLLCIGLLNKYPTKGIGFITPMNFSTGQTPEGKKLIDYVNAIKEVCGYYSIPAFDLYLGSGIPTNNTARKTALIPDRLHPNTRGHEILGNRMEQFVLSSSSSYSDDIVQQSK